ATLARRPGTSVCRLAPSWSALGGARLKSTPPAEPSLQQLPPSDAAYHPEHFRCHTGGECRGAGGPRVSVARLPATAARRLHVGKPPWDRAAPGGDPPDRAWRRWRLRDDQAGARQVARMDTIA